MSIKKVAFRHAKTVKLAYDDEDLRFVCHPVVWAASHEKLRTHVRTHAHTYTHKTTINDKKAMHGT